MIFSSLLFLFRFLPAAILLYFAAPSRFKNAVLFAASLVFYGWGEPVYILIMLFSTASDYIHARLIYKFKNSGLKKAARGFMISSVVINLSLLGFFKYAGIFALPIGISFYTFQTMSYTLDVYMSDEVPLENIIDFGAYVTMFPQLVAGPIVKYHDIAAQLRVRRTDTDGFYTGIRRFITGLGKKVLFANNIGLLWDSVKSAQPAAESTVTLWLGIIAFALQIYYDFSGYSDMAIGLGKMFGFSFMENFNYPYVSKNITEFFRRWHISLGTWFKEYVYIPLGGSRCSRAKNIRNLMAVWLLTGIWHGATYNFLLWGLYFGIIIVMEKLFILKLQKKIPAFFNHLYALAAVLIGWVIFEFETLGEIALYIKGMMGIGTAEFFGDDAKFILAQYALIFVVLIFMATPFPKRAVLYLKEKSETMKLSALSYILENLYNIGIFVIAAAYLVNDSYNPFLYFRF